MKSDHLIKCSVTDCIYNDNVCCTSSAIKINGEDAKTSVQTRCDTFSTKQGIMSSILSAADNTGSTKINCKAIHCRYNDDTKCTLESIDVGCTCDPCNCSSASETVCNSFKHNC
ncbi:MAG: DUF1540 domain-containing protein [Clostridia bacterium]|nr:DUF1540 domain-containing protein [Clostridia bacterium]